MSGLVALLGLDPAPGDPDEVRRLARAAGRTARRLGSAAERLRSLGADHGLWQGEAAEAFRTRIDDLPRRLDDAAAALSAVRGTLDGFAERLEDAQRRARLLAGEAHEVLTGPEPVVVAYDSRPARLAAVRRRAHALRAEVAADAAATATVLRQAAERAPDEPSRLERAVGALDAWVEDVVVENARAVEVVSLALGVAASVAAATGVGLSVAAPLAAASYAASLALVHYTEADEDDLLLATVGLLTFGVGTAAASTVRAAHLAGATASTSSGAAAWATTASVAATVGRGAGRTGWAVTAWSGGVTAAGVHGDARQRSARRRQPLVIAPGAPPGGAAGAVPQPG
ncbi:MAG TPA: hypothetical protein VNU26_00310 [Mycobacteriales bacterium]|nr:hypothetical protein [Mycobacteriales bacterium]